MNSLRNACPGAGSSCCSEDRTTLRTRARLPGRCRLDLRSTGREGAGCEAGGGPGALLYRRLRRCITQLLKHSHPLPSLVLRGREARAPWPPEAAGRAQPRRPRREGLGEGWRWPPLVLTACRGRGREERASCRAWHACNPPSPQRCGRKR